VLAKAHRVLGFLYSLELLFLTLYYSISGLLSIFVFSSFLLSSFFREFIGYIVINNYVVL
jgi:hypothetical protein